MFVIFEKLDKRQTNVRQMSDKCQTNVRQMSDKCQINGRQMADKWQKTTETEDKQTNKEKII